MGLNLEIAMDYFYGPIVISQESPSQIKGARGHRIAAMARKCNKEWTLGVSRAEASTNCSC